MRKKVVALVCSALLTLAAVVPAWAVDAGDFASPDAAESAYTITQAQNIAQSIMEDWRYDMDVSLSGDIMLDHIRALTTGEKTDVTKALAHLIQFNKINKSFVMFLSAADLQITGAKGAITVDAPANEIEDGQACYAIFLGDGKATYQIDYVSNGSVTFDYNQYGNVLALLWTHYTKRNAPTYVMGTSWALGYTNNEIEDMAKDAVKNAVDDAITNDRVTAGTGITNLTILPGISVQRALDLLQDFVEDIIRAANSNVEKVMTFTVEASGSGTVTFTVGAEYNGKYAVIGHYHNNHWTQQQALVRGGRISGYFQDFSPFTIVITNSTQELNLPDTENAVSSNRDDSSDGGSTSKSSSKSKKSSSASNQGAAADQTAAVTNPALPEGTYAVSPKTGDDRNVAWYVFGMIASIAVLVGTRRWTR